MLKQLLNKNSRGRDRHERMVNPRDYAGVSDEDIERSFCAAQVNRDILTELLKKSVGRKRTSRENIDIKHYLRKVARYEKIATCQEGSAMVLQKVIDVGEEASRMHKLRKAVTAQAKLTNRKIKICGNNADEGMQHLEKTINLMDYNTGSLPIMEGMTHFMSVDHSKDTVEGFGNLVCNADEDEILTEIMMNVMVVEGKTEEIEEKKKDRVIKMKPPHEAMSKLSVGEEEDTSQYGYYKRRSRIYADQRS